MKKISTMKKDPIRPLYWISEKFRPWIFQIHTENLGHQQFIKSIIL